MARPFKPAFQKMSPSWSAHCDQVPDKYTRSFLRSLGSFCSAKKIEPADVCETALIAFEAAIRASGRERPTQHVRDTRKSWNSAARHIPGWPQLILEVSDRRQNPSIPLGQMPESFRADVAAFLTRSSNGGRFKPRQNGPRSPATRIDTARKIMQIVTILNKHGWQFEQLQGLNDLVKIEALEVILDDLWAGGTGEDCGHHYNRTRLLKAIAKHWAHSDQKTLELLKEAERAFHSKPDGLSDRNRAKLRQFTDDENIRRLVNLPNNILKNINPLTPNLTDAIEIQSALAVSILLVAPVRAKNLAAIDLTLHVHRVSANNCYLIFPDFEVKNKVKLEYPLPPSMLELFDVYMSVYHPLLMRADTNALFISRTARQKTEAELGAQIPRFILKHLGINLNLHLFRHLAAFIYLRKHPGDYETVRRLLNHKSQRTTLAFYTGLEHADAFKRFDAIIDTYVTNKKAG